MKIMRLVALLVLSVCFSSALYAAEKNPTIPERVNRQTMFNNITDGLATMGKSNHEKGVIRKQRKNARRLNRLRKIRTLQQAEFQRKQKERGF